MAVIVASLLAVVAFALGIVNGGYVLTTPRRWATNTQAQVCVVLTEGTFTPQDSLSLTLTQIKNKEILKEYKLSFPEGESQNCANVTVPATEDREVTLSFAGSFLNEPVLESVNLTFVGDTRRTFIQTDKYLYKPGHQVQFRILSLSGANLSVVTENYDVFITSPSKTRIAQWLNVDNSAGLVHLSYDLFDEVEQGDYSIEVKFTEKAQDIKIFKVEDYELPRFEVTIKSPKPILGNDEEVIITLCARYTFGEPVAGNATLSLAAASWKVYANLTESKKISGCANFTFPSKDLLFDQNNCHIRISNLKAHATVVEDGTGVELRGSNDNIQVHRSAIQFRDESPTETSKPYLPSSIKVATTFLDGSPATNETMEACIYHIEQVCKNFTTCDKGYLSFMMPSDWNSRLEIRAVKYPRIERNWNEVMEDSRFYKHKYGGKQYVDATNNSLTIFFGEKIHCPSPAEDMRITIPVVYITKDPLPTDVHIQVSSRGQVVASSKVAVEFVENEVPFGKDWLLPIESVPEGTVRGMFNASLVLGPTVSPKITILVWYSTPDGTIVADNKDIEISDCLPHTVDFAWSDKKVQPGKEANLVVKGANNALCSIGVVDKSVDLLTPEDSQLDIKSILQITRNYEVVDWDSNQLNLWYCIRKYNSSTEGNSTTEGEPKLSSGGSFGRFGTSPVTPFFDAYSSLEAIHVFNRAGYFVVSNLVLEKLYCDHLITQNLKHQFHHDGVNRPLAISTKIPHQAPSPAGATFQSFIPVPESLLEDTATDKEGSIDTTTERSYLPETWLWLLKPLSPSGEFNESMTLPDTITEWVGKAVCLHPTEGLGISNSTSITTFTTFFVDLTLPLTAKRGEIVPIKISIFNYLDEDLPVKVFLEPSENHKFVEGETGIREACIPSKAKIVETIKVNLTQIGDTNLTVEASSQPLSSGSCGSGTPPTKKDRFVRSLPVEPEGYLREKTFTKYICSQDVKDTQGPIESWPLDAPETAVEGSKRAWVTAIGDLLGPTIENIGHLIRLPSGCGEQNMVNFAPNIYILQYLEASNQTTPSIKAKITNFLNQGYQRQLLFRHSSDGSFSAFGEKDKNGSTWLTAFVVKSLSQAKPFTQIDEVTLDQSADWLKSLQDKDGCFESRGRVINKMLQGGIKGSEGSKGLLAAYVLAAILEEGNVTEEIVSKSINCIQTDTSDHPYSLALRGYSLALAKASNAKAVIDQLVAASASNSSIMRWSLPDRTGENTALHVETAAYALLALVTLDPKTYAEESRKIVRWLSDQRNGQGGFVSTQDTVVALQALAAFEKAQPRENVNMDVTFSATPDLNQTFKVTEDNKFLQQRVDVPALPATVNLTINGQGCSLVQGVLRYNVLAESLSDAFTLSVQSKQAPGKDCKTHTISACTSYTLPDGASNMAILEVKLISGYIPIKNDLKKVVGNGLGTFKRYEVDRSKIDFYLEEVNATQICANFSVYQDIEIENAKPGSVTIYDYYQPEYIATQKFSFTSENCSTNAV